MMSLISVSSTSVKRSIARQTRNGSITKRMRKNTRTTSLSPIEISRARSSEFGEGICQETICRRDLVPSRSSNRVIYWSGDLIMKWAWSTAICILCGSGEDITTEHVIPDCLAGKLVADFLCKDCNSRFGHGAERDVKNDPKIRLSIERLAVEQPSLADKLQKQLPYIGYSEQGEIPGHMHDGKFVPSEQKLDDGSLIVPAEQSLQHVKNMAERDGEVRWPRLFGQVGGLIKVYSSCRSCRQNPFASISLPLLLRLWGCGQGA